MAISRVGAANIDQKTVAITPPFGAGWAADDIHLIWMRVKSTASNVPAAPANYDDILTTVSSGNTITRICARKLAGGNVAPSITPVSGVETMIASITLRGCRLDSIANLIEAASATSISSATQITYPAATIATAGCMALVFGSYNASFGTLGTPTTLSGSAVNAIPAFVGSNMQGVLWTDLQTTAANITAGNIPITGGSNQTNRGQIVVIRPAVGSGVVVTNIGDELIYNGETAVTITGTGFRTTQGVGFVKVSPTDNVNDAAAVTQTITSWADTSIQFTAGLGTFGYFANLYVFVTNSSAQVNAAGFVIQREARARANLTLFDGGSAWANKTAVLYRICAASINGTALLSNSNGTTDGSGVFQSPYYTLVNAGPLAPNDPWYLSVFKEDATLANTRAMTLKITPTYE